MNMKYILIATLFAIKSSWASSIQFKPASTLPNQGFVYFCLGVTLLVISVLIYLFRKQYRATQKDVDVTIELQRRLSSKIGVYVISYQNQKWLIVDNGQTLCMEKLSHDQT